MFNDRNASEKSKAQSLLRRTWDEKAFFTEIARIKEESLSDCLKYRLWTSSKGGRYTHFHVNGAEIWYGEEPFYVHLVDKPGTLSGDILRYKTDLPRYGCHLEIFGDDVREINFKPYPEEPEEDWDRLDEDAKDIFATLPVLSVDDSIHFAKPARTRREIEILLKCRGSPYIIQLLGRTEEGKLLFPKYKSDLFTAALRERSIASIKKWMLDIVEGLTYLHSLGLTYRDFVPRNFLHGDPVVICDLECRLASQACKAPELLVSDETPDAAYTTASDVYGLGVLLKLLCYANNPRSPYVHWPVLPPFDKIYEACMQRKPENRPTLVQIKVWLRDI